MSSNLFWPIYRNLENELKELSNHIYMNQKQLNVYSVKIADLILRTVAEIENLLKELCHKEGIKFLDKNRRKRKIVNFHEYHEKIEEKYLLSKKHVAAIYDGFSEDLFYGGKILPFKRKEITKNGKKIKIIPWHQAYNMIKHDRTKNFKLANLENLITAIAALFLLNVYHKDQEFNSIDHGNLDSILSKIHDFSDVFEVDSSPDVTSIAEVHDKKDSFFDPIGYFRIASKYSAYIIQHDKKVKTSNDHARDMLDAMEASIAYMNNETGNFELKNPGYIKTDHYSECALIVTLNKNRDCKPNCVTALIGYPNAGNDERVRHNGTGTTPSSSQRLGNKHQDGSRPQATIATPAEDDGRGCFKRGIG
ncbi:hypothetical protein [Thiothrix unzii]|jgi:hypothetical protein|uniref:hypothetical protein n=1 Tax=Thiothrix unzii TaxID=111769 RepID=UPI002A36F8F4|nr:hypothetical protein [Thiothrix unzii]MDX9987574.1 hypothetical protein [Thiothrix unzii]